MVERCVDDPQAPTYDRGVLVLYDEVGRVLYPNELEQGAVLVRRRLES